jgi:hypothetical protein
MKSQANQNKKNTRNKTRPYEARDAMDIHGADSMIFVSIMLDKYDIHIRVGIYYKHVIYMNYKVPADIYIYSWIII